VPGHGLAEGGLGRRADLGQCGVAHQGALLHQFRRLAIRSERRPDIHDSLVSLARA
jgi:hypothetical protein